MSIYHNFIGIDIGKFSFTVAYHGKNNVKEYENTSSGISTFFKEFKRELPKTLVILEATGGYEMELLLSICDKKIAVHRANTRKVKSFIRSFGHAAKTDALDAKALAHYGCERHKSLDLFVPASAHLLTLYTLVQRRHDLKKILVAEKNRSKGPKAGPIQESCAIVIQTVEAQIKLISTRIEELIEQDPALQERQKVLMTIPGIGKIVSQELLSLMPELGTLNRKQAACLAGLAPRANDSGKLKGYRSTGHGRQGVKPMLFLAAMAARGSNSPLKEFYNNLVNRGKKKLVALTALMRKIIVIANARLKNLAKGKMVST
jgi:transposase